MTSNTRVLIASVPNGPLGPEHFEVEEAAAPECGEGQVLCRTLALTIGAGQRAGLQGSASYAGAPKAGVRDGRDRRRARRGVARAGFAPGDLVVGAHRLADTFRARTLGAARGARRRRSRAAPRRARHQRSHRLLRAARRRPSRKPGTPSSSPPRRDRSVTSSARSRSCKGCRVVGVAGSAAKCGILVDELGFDVALNYKDDDFRAAFKEATPDRIDVYFDNTGGDILGSALFRMKTHGRIVCCGAVSQYDTANPAGSPRGIPGLLVNNRVRMEGFLVFDYADRYDQARAELLRWIERGELVPRVTEFEGLESAPKAFVELLRGDTVGTTIVRVR